MDLTDAIKEFAPSIATALGGPLAGLAVGFISKQFGVPADQVQQTIAGADPVKLKQLELDFQQHLADNGIQLQLAQIEVNKAEASSGSFWNSGWRPGVGWVGVASLALMYIPKALVLTTVWGVQAYEVIHVWNGTTALTVPPFPDLGVTDVVGLLMAILGMGTLRTVDKFNGVESK